MENMPLDENGFPVLPRAPLDPDGKHWGMKYSIGWSNPVHCPDRALVWHVLARTNRVGIEEAVRHYGYDLVLAFWETMKKRGRIKDTPTIYSHNNGDLIRSAIPVVDSILMSLQKETNG